MYAPLNTKNYIENGHKKRQANATENNTTRRAALLLISHLAFIKFDFIVVAVVAWDVATVGGGDVAAAAVDCRTAHG